MMTEKINSKFLALAEMIKAIQPAYLKSDKAGRDLIETTIGAAIFYLPSSKKKLFSGLISEEAKKNGERCKEHMYPRKVSAQRLLTTDWSDVTDSGKHLSDLYHLELGRYNYVTKKENQLLKPHQKIGNFISPEHSYAAVGIKLLTSV